METATIEAPSAATGSEAPNAGSSIPQSPEVNAQEAQAQAQGTTQTAAAESPTVDREAELTRVNQYVKDNPEEKLNEADLKIFMDGQSGKLKPKTLDGKIDAGKEPQKKEEVKPADIPEPIAKAMKSIGAKTVEEIPEKIAGLIQQVHGKDAQAVSTLTKERDTLKTTADTAARFLEDLKAGKPEAFDFLKRQGVMLPKEMAEPNEPFDPDVDAALGGVLSRQEAKMQKLLSRLEQFEGKAESEAQARIKQANDERSRSQVVDEALAGAQFIPELKDVPNLRNMIVDLMEYGKSDPALAPLNKLSEMITSAGEKGHFYDLETAHYIDMGKNAKFLIEKAREEGRREAHTSKPNRSLSSVASEAQEQNIQQVTEAELDQMEGPGGWRMIPEAWKNADGSMNISKMPKNAAARFKRPS